MPTITPVWPLQTAHALSEFYCIQGSLVSVFAVLTSPGKKRDDDNTANNDITSEARKLAKQSQCGMLKRGLSSLVDVDLDKQHQHQEQQQPIHQRSWVAPHGCCIERLQPLAFLLVARTYNSSANNNTTIIVSQCGLAVRR